MLKNKGEMLKFFSGLRPNVYKNTSNEKKFFFTACPLTVPMHTRTRAREERTRMRTCCWYRDDSCAPRPDVRGRWARTMQDVPTMQNIYISYRG